MFKSNDGDQLIRVATYARVSTQEQATENTSMASQEGQLIAYCQMRGWTIINSYVDPGFTGKNGDRPGLKRLMADARIGLFDKVLVCKLDRLARSLRVLMDVEAELKEYHISLTSIRESVDTSNGTGKMVFQLFGMVAEWDRENIIERTKSGRIQRYKNGCWAGGKPTFGYSYDKTTRKLVINEDQAKIVRFIFDKYNSGKSLKTMNQLLDDQRIPTIRGKKRGWIDSGIRFILINPIYKGTLIVSRNCHITNIDKADLSKAIVIKVPAIVSESVWNMAQNHLRTNKKLRPPRKNPWLLQGLITCGQCGLSYQGQYRTAIDRVYACRGRLRESHTDGSPRCNGPTLITKWLEDEVWLKISDILANPDKLREVIQESLGILKGRQAELDSILKPINEKLVDITDKKARLADQWVITNMDPEKYKKLQSNLNKEETRLKSLRANMDPSRLSELESINATLQYWHDQFQSTAVAAEGNGAGVNILEKTKSAIKVYGFEDIELIENITSIAAKREIMDRLRVNLVVFKDRIEIRCEIPMEAERSVNVILNLEIPLFRSTGTALNFRNKIRVI
jgi:site-specific DNA recombinase